MEEYTSQNTGNEEKVLRELKPTLFFSSLYQKKWDDLNNGAKSPFRKTLFVKYVYETITNLAPEAGKIYDEVYQALRDASVDKAVEISIQVLSRSLPPTDLEDKLGKLEEKL